MKLQQAPPDYDKRDQSLVRRALEAADGDNFKRGQDVRLARGERFIQKATSGGKNFRTFFDGNDRLCFQEVE